MEHNNRNPKSNNKNKKADKCKSEKCYKKPGIHEIELSVRALPTTTAYANY